MNLDIFKPVLNQSPGSTRARIYASEADGVREITTIPMIEP
jgi:hypothetical protein